VYYGPVGQTKERTCESYFRGGSQRQELESENKRLKQDYEEITPCLKDVTLVWERMLATPGRSKVKFDSDTIHAAVTQGTPPRGTARRTALCVC
jgi:hypothetical protein